MNISVIGAGSPTKDGYRLAENIGRRVAERGAVLICGGLGGIMEAAAKGARSAGGITAGILPGCYAGDANPYITVPIVTGMADARNVIVVRSADIVIAVEGKYGTLSEVAIALKIGKPVIGINTWDCADEVYKAGSVNDVMDMVEHLIKEKKLE